MSTNSDPRKVYNAIAKYFGLRARDAFLNPLAASKVAADSEGNSSSPETKLMDELFSNGNTFQKIEEISKKIKGKISDQVCATSWSDTNKFKGYNYAARLQNPDQGWGIQADDQVKLKDLIVDKASDPEGFDAALFQVFPIATGMDVVDSDIVSLFLNSIRTLTMSQAVPYIDVKIISSADSDSAGGNFTKAPDMSLGRFLSAKKENAEMDDPMLAKFVLREDIAGNSKKNLNAVAGMEVFTTPQTMVNAEKKSYSRADGGPVDVFRPFMTLQSLTVKDEFSGAGTISYKSAEMNLVLFDKGRLQEIKEFVAPRRDPYIKFQITYGWSHPDGTNFSRASDSDADTRLGRLVDAMRVTELYTLVTSNFSMQSDGTIEISLSLSMDAGRQLGIKDISEFALGANSGAINIVDLNRKLDTIKNTFLEANKQSGGRIEIPSFIQAASAQSLLSLDTDSLTALKKFIDTVRTKAKKEPMGLAAAELYSILGKPKKNSEGVFNLHNLLLKSRGDLVEAFINKLRTTPDPFLRLESPPGTVRQNDYKKGAATLARPKKGKKKNIPQDKPGAKSTRITERNQQPGAKSQKQQSYVSYGKLLAAVLIPIFRTSNTEVQMIFSSFNANAAGVYDHNISQFPIFLDDLKELMTQELRRKSTMQVSEFIKFVNDNFLTFQGARAFGLAQVYQRGVRDEEGGRNAKLLASVKKLTEEENASNQFEFETILKKNLTAIYGPGRSNPVFTPPRVNVRFTTKKSSNSEKDVVRIHVQDVAAGRQMTITDALMSLIRDGYAKQENYSGTGTARGPRHNEVYQKNFGELEDRGILGNPSEEVLKTIKGRLEEKKVPTATVKSLIAKYRNYKVLLKAPKNVRKFFYENSPYLFHGTEGSGIIEAGVSSETDDQLTSIFLAQRYSGKGESKTGPQNLQLPFQVNPSNMSMKTFGCPLLRLTQKYFIDMGTNTSIDNFYTCQSVSHTIDESGFFTDVNMKPYDAWGILANALSKTEDILFNLTYKESLQKKNKKK